MSDPDPDERVELSDFEVGLELELMCQCKAVGAVVITTNCLLHHPLIGLLAGKPNFTGLSGLGGSPHV